MSATLLLRLAGPLQAWGDSSSRFTRRDTRQEPTKSGVVGLLAAAQGRRRTDPVEDLVGLRFGVRCDQRGRLVRDFQTAVRERDRQSMPLSYRYYLADAAFLCGVEGERAALEGLADAVRAPRFPLYLGRRSCPPDGPIELSLVDGQLEAALRSAPWRAASWYRRQQGNPVALEIVMDAEPHESSVEVLESARDVPISFASERREYGWRDISRPAPQEVDNPDGHHRPDFFAALGGA